MKVNNNLIKERATFTNLLKEIKSEEIFEEKIWFLFLNEEEIESMELMSSNIKNNFKRWKTKSLYEHNFSNLVSENPVGYSLLISELIIMRDYQKNISEEQKLNSRLESIIGEYDLHPIRVCDILLDLLLEKSSQYLIGFLLSFSKQIVSNLIESRLQLMNQTEYSEKYKNDFLMLIYELIQYEIISFELVWNNLSPLKEYFILQEFAKWKEYSFEIFQKNFVVQLVVNEDVKDMEDKREKEITEFFSTDNTPKSNFLKLDFFIIMVQSHDEKNIDWVLNRWNYQAIPFYLYHNLYQTYSSYLKSKISQDNLFVKILPKLKVFGVSLFKDTSLFFQVLDLLNNNINLIKESDDDDEMNETELYVSTYIIPAITISQNNSPLWKELYKILQKVGLKKRFRIYEKFFKDNFLKNEFLIFKHAQNIQNLKKSFKTLTDKKDKSISHNFQKSLLFYLIS